MDAQISGLRPHARCPSCAEGGQSENMARYSYEEIQDPDCARGIDLELQALRHMLGDHLECLHRDYDFSLRSIAVTTAALLSHAEDSGRRDLAEARVTRWLLAVIAIIQLAMLAIGLYVAFPGLFPSTATEHNRLPFNEGGTGMSSALSAESA